jgi:hypothetical protein
MGLNSAEYAQWKKKREEMVINANGAHPRVVGGGCVCAHERASLLLETYLLLVASFVATL